MEVYVGEAKEVHLDSIDVEKKTFDIFEKDEVQRIVKIDAGICAMVVAVDVVQTANPARKEVEVAENF